jgi:hypothetical protein
MQVCIDWHGTISECIMLQPSHIVMFDVSVRSSLKDMVFPRSAYGKEITLTFMQEKKL